eukprot:8063453-Karenia_brevis.AAC.1
MHKVLLPHEVFSAIYHHNPDLFQKAFVGDKGTAGLQEFWDSEDQEWVSKHPGFHQEKPLPRCYAIPGGFHADKGQHIKRDKIL